MSLSLELQSIVLKYLRTQNTCGARQTYSRDPRLRLGRGRGSGGARSTLLQRRELRRQRWRRQRASDL